MVEFIGSSVLDFNFFLIGSFRPSLILTDHASKQNFQVLNIGVNSLILTDHASKQNFQVLNIVVNSKSSIYWGRWRSGSASKSANLERCLRVVTGIDSRLVDSMHTTRTNIPFIWEIPATTVSKSFFD